MTTGGTTVIDLDDRVSALLAEPRIIDRSERREFLRARFDAGLAWVHYPEGLGGLGLPRSHQSEVDRLLAAGDAPDTEAGSIGIGIGMAAPTILAHGTPEQQRRFLRPLWTGEEIWCQLFSEPGAGSDLAAVGTKAVRDGDDWIITGQKVWTSSAHEADLAILLTRTDPDLPKHQGLTFFVLDMSDSGVDVRPLRQITGEAEFNEVFLNGARVPDAWRLGAIGDGWRVANATLANERVAIGDGDGERESGMIEKVAQAWRSDPGLRSAATHDRLMQGWVDAEVFRLTGQRMRQRLATGSPGAESAAMKLMFARIAQDLSGLEVEIRGEDGLRYSDWSMVRPERVDLTGRDAGYRYLRAKGNSIEGGTSEVLRNIIAERVLGLPPEPRTDRNLPWKDIPR